jgi:hypothetical protein
MPAVARIFDGEKEAKLIPLACSKPPKGRARWTLRLLENKVVELGIVDRASDSTIGRALKKTSSAPSPPALDHPAEGQQRVRSCAMPTTPRPTGAAHWRITRPDDNAIGVGSWSKSGAKSHEEICGISARWFVSRCSATLNNAEEVNMGPTAIRSVPARALQRVIGEASS